ncbi:MAG: hypothetical protein B7C24_14885 [Bacteroidetes bacterium 4572_77]|nr:MAG: hypothetical protein B7C24_14885 [Bacteroidetes bacterium 4572_77]
MIYGIVAFGQLTFLPNDISKAKKLLPDNIKTIRQYKGDLLLNVREYDTLKNLTFSHYKQYVRENWNGKYITMITANLYNDTGMLIKTYHLHSNAGLSIWYYEYDSLGNNTKLFIRNNDYEHHDSLINTNPYHYIAEITNINELASHLKIKDIERLAQKFLYWERSYDSIGNMLTELSFKENGDTSGYQRYEYDENNNKIYFYNEWSKENHWEYYYEYEKKYLFFEEDAKTETKPANLLQSVRVDFDWRENRKRIADITLYKYDENDRLIEKSKYDKGEFQDKYVYKYNEIGQVIKRTAYVYNPNKIVSIKTYLHNKEGNVIKKTDEDFRSGEKSKNEYRYIYEYYK